MELQKSLFDRYFPLVLLHVPLIRQDEHAAALRWIEHFRAHYNFRPAEFDIVRSDMWTVFRRRVQIDPKWTIPQPGSQPVVFPRRISQEEAHRHLKHASRILDLSYVTDQDRHALYRALESEATWVVHRWKAEHDLCKDSPTIN